MNEVIDNIQGIFDNIQQASIRVRRLYAIACYGYVKSVAKSKPCNEAVEFAASHLADNGYLALFAGMRNHQKATKDAHEAMDSVSAGTLGPKRYQREIARELAGCTVHETVDMRRLTSGIWGMRGWLGKNFDADLVDCLDLATNKHRVLTPDFQLTSHIVGLAQDVYEGDDGLRGILADAIEDTGCGDLWVSHLRSDKQHWKGCWAIDTILGKN